MTLATESLAQIFIASVAADFARKVTLHPIDTMATRLQYDRSFSKARVERIPLLGDAKAIVGILSAPGEAKLYRGLSTSLAGAVPVSLVYMPTYELTSQAFKGLNQAHGLPIPSSQLAGIATGVVCAFVRVPLAVIKARVQLGLFATPWLAIAAAVRAGWRELFVGLGAVRTVGSHTRCHSTTPGHAGRRGITDDAVDAGSLRLCRRPSPWT